MLPRLFSRILKASGEYDSAFLPHDVFILSFDRSEPAPDE